MICLASQNLFMTRSRGYERWRKMTWKPEQTANPVQTTAFSWGKKGFPGDGVDVGNPLYDWISFRGFGWIPPLYIYTRRFTTVVEGVHLPSLRSSPKIRSLAMNPGYRALF